MEQLKEPEVYIARFVSLRRGRITAKDALWIEKREDEEYPGSGWYKLHPLNIDLGTWDEDEDALRDVDIDAWNYKAFELLNEVRAKDRARTRNYVIYISSFLGPSLLILGWLQDNASYSSVGLFLSFIAAIAWWSIVKAKLGKRS